MEQLIRFSSVPPHLLCLCLPLRDLSVCVLGVQGSQGRRVIGSPSAPLVVAHSHSVNIPLQVVTLMKGAQQGTACVMACVCVCVACKYLPP